MPSDRTESKKNWLNQHDSLQEELMRLKKDLVKTKEDVLTEIRKDTVPAVGADGPRSPDRSKNILTPEEPIKAVEVPDDVDTPQTDMKRVSIPEPRTEPRPDHTPAKERSIRDLISAPAEDRKEPSEEGLAGSHALPKHPELNSYIAKVMQHESKLKRKKYEREKTTKPPRTDAPQDPKKTDAEAFKVDTVEEKTEETLPPNVEPEPIPPTPGTEPAPPTPPAEPEPAPPPPLMTQVEPQPYMPEPEKAQVTFDPGSFTPKETRYNPPTVQTRITGPARSSTKREVLDEPKGGFMSRIRRIWKKK